MIQTFEIGLPLGRRVMTKGLNARSWFRAGNALRMAARLPAVSLLGVALAALIGGLGASAALAATQAPAGCKGVTLAVIPVQGAISNPDGTEGGHFWWRNGSGGTCVGTVIEDVQVGAETSSLVLRVVVFDRSDPGGLTVRKQQVTAGPGPISQQLGIHEVFAGLTEVCVVATSPVIPSDTSCVQLAAPPPAQQFTQGPGTSQQQQLATQLLWPQWPWPSWPWP